MKINITESQLKKIINEIGGYDDKNVMNVHASNLQSPLLQSMSTTASMLSSFLGIVKYGDVSIEKIKNYLDKVNIKLSMDIELINHFGDEIYVDKDFRGLIRDYKTTLTTLQNNLRLIYSDEGGMIYDMTKKESISSIIRFIEGVEPMITKLASMFENVHSRYRSRLGFN
jgi:hypothetical protein